MTSENGAGQGSQEAHIASENTDTDRLPRHGRAPVDLPDRFTTVFDAYAIALASAPLSKQTRRTYASKVRQYLTQPTDQDRLDALDLLTVDK